MKVLLILAGVLLANSLQAMEPLPDVEMSAVSGREGVAIDFEFRLNSGSGGAPLASLGSCSGLGNPCTMAINLNNRPNEWLVLKDMYGLMRINSLFLDGAETPIGDGAYADGRRFLNQAGSGCLTGQGTAPNCRANDLPALGLSFPGGTSTFETDIEWHLNLGRAAVQYGANEYLPADDISAKSFLGLRITDKLQTAARIDIDGRALLFGF